MRGRAPGGRAGRRERRTAPRDAGVVGVGRERGTSRPGGSAMSGGVPGGPDPRSATVPGADGSAPVARGVAGVRRVDPALDLPAPSSPQARHAAASPALTGVSA